MGMVFNKGTKANLIAVLKHAIIGVRADVIGDPGDVGLLIKYIRGAVCENEDEEEWLDQCESSDMVNPCLEYLMKTGQVRTTYQIAQIERQNEAMLAPTE